MNLWRDKTVAMSFVGACGGRRYNNQAVVHDTFCDIAGRISGRIVVVTGAAPGADRLSRLTAISFGWDVVDVPAIWTQHGKAAGPIRNDIIAVFPLHYLVAFPGGAGTADMVRKAKAAGIEVLEVGVEGT